MVLDFVALGNAIVDIIAPCDEELLRKNNIKKGAMHLISAEQAENFYAQMSTPLESAGGSAANSAVVASQLGAKAGFLGTVCDDKLGHVFARSLHEARVVYENLQLENVPPTARSFIFITPDSERTMNTYLGACRCFGPEHLDFALLKRAKRLYIEGYLYDEEKAKLAVNQAIVFGHQHEQNIALSLSDSLCVERHRSDFVKLIHSGDVDIIFANQDELLALYQMQDIEEAFAQLQRNIRSFAAITNGEEGSTILTATEQIKIEAPVLREIVDLTGAGDSYAGGFLTGCAYEFDLERCGRIGTYAAAHIIQVIGARPKIDLYAALQKLSHLHSE